MVPISGLRLGAVDISTLSIGPIVAMGTAEHILFLRSCTISAALAMGRAEWQVRSLLGKPRNIEGPITMQGKWPFAKAADKNWLYGSGESHTLVVSFRDGICSHAEVFDSCDDIEYQSWKSEQISSFAKGRIAEEIFARYGLPQFQLTTKDSGLEQTHVTSKQQLGSSGLWVNDTGSSVAVELKIENYRCIDFEPMRYWY